MRLVFRPVGKPGDQYPQWVRDLRHKSGAYVFRHVETKEVLYVGESHSARLYATLSRHLQQWRDTKGHWGREHHWHVFLERERMELAVTVTSAARAVRMQDRLILELKPRYNTKLPEDDGCPF